MKTEVYNKLKPKINFGIYLRGEKGRQWDTADSQQCTDSKKQV